VWEWTADWFGAYATAATTNPPGAKTGTARVLRGGAWYTRDASIARAAYRSRNAPTDRISSVGFRCAREN
jgi:formylglycine-generating enzyme required for sulfatase activity